MEISKDTLLVIEAIDNYSEGTLRKKNDLTNIFEICASFNLTKEIETLIFSGKILWNLYRTIKRPDLEQDTLVGVQNEFQNTLEKIREVLISIQNNSEETFQKRLQDTYLEMTKGCVLNIVDLCHDFGKFKDMQNTIKNAQN